MPDHVYMYVSIPPKVSILKRIGRIKGKSALMLFDRHPEYREKYKRHFWARGYYCVTIGRVSEETILKYISEQYERDRLEGEKQTAFKRSPVTDNELLDPAFRRNSNNGSVG